VSDRAAAAFANVDSAALAAGLDRQGYAIIPALLSADACRGLAALYGRDELFRSRIVMARHAFGLGEYKYFRYPLPSLVQSLRQGLYPHLVGTANRWCEWLGADERLLLALVDYLARCHEAGQVRPTPLVLKYETGGYNCLHQDLYGALAFPLQATILLSAPGEDFTGGEFLLVEQRPRAQSKGEVVPLAQGDAVVFAVNRRPVEGKRGFYRVALRHGVSRVRNGQRFTLGIIFHDAA
jgi:hypothetical protein